MSKLFGGKFLFGVLLAIVGVMGCQQAADLLTGVNNQVATGVPTSQPVGGVILPTPIPTPKPDRINETAQTVGNIAQTVSAVSPPGTPVHNAAVITAAISGLVISVNELLKNRKKNPPTQ